MDRRRFLRGVAIAGAGAFAAPMLNLGRCSLAAATAAAPGAPVRSRVSGEGPVDLRPVPIRAVELVQRTAVIDMLSLLTLDWGLLARWKREPAAFGETEFRRLRASGITVFHPAVEPNQPDAAAAVRRWLAGWDRLLAAHPRYFARVEGPGDLDAARLSGKVGLLVGFQNSDHFASVTDVERFHRLGQRVSQLTYDTRNALGSGCREQRDRGLTGFGAGVVAAMNRLGMAVDVSHCGERTSLDTFAASRRPVLVTHSNCEALVPGHPRCKSDAVLRAMARGGGVIGITAVSAYVRQPVATLEDLLDHFEHVARVAGVEHVGLGSDVDVDALDQRTGRVRPAYAIRGLDHQRRTFDLVEGLLRRGWREADVELVLAGNFRRALAAIWAPPRPATVAGVPAAAPA
jgi:membrane dipeptidase